jgi:esterase/lipase
MLTKTHVYFVPGLAASSKIFEHISLPDDQFEMHYLDWLMPISQNEPLNDYAKRLSEKIIYKDPVLVGVSFGGVMVQEMSKHIKTKRTIIISSIKAKSEMPKTLQIIKVTKMYKLLPTKAIVNIEEFAKFSFGKVAEKRIKLYKNYFSMRNVMYVQWAISNLLNWQQKDPLLNVIHIHGDNDGVFPIKYIKNCTVINGGTHIMILNKAKKISKLLIELI